MSLIIGVQEYDWLQIYEAQGQRHRDHLDEIFAALTECGIEAWEQSVSSAEEAQRLKTLLGKHGLKMPSMYAGGSLHTQDWQKSVEQILQQARWAAPLGVNVVAVNPDPLSWGKVMDKTDGQLKQQAEAMQNLGERLTAEGMALAYHTHDAEMRAAAREFHHMMLATAPQHVGLCLDTHWIYRGAGNSQVALYDIVKLYGSRIRSLHIRQSHNGVWAETVGDGDIDYQPLAQQLKAQNFQGPIIIERAIEAGTPRTMSGVEAHRRSAEWVRQVFAF
ncbi:MAG: TIM barrel protein [Abitibacteriaceae bacterium]|nr:TIM barrel protein [Abditibacteriaceae bacterium]MBV9865119.1 TIM barrel protein [Abditibacteriaceae bacterium]